MLNPEPSPPPSTVSEPAFFGCELRHSGRDAAWLRLTGELDEATAWRLTQRLEDALAGARLVIVDLRELTFMDRSGLGTLVAAHDRARRSDRRLVVVRGRPHVDRLLDLSGFADRLEITNLQLIHDRFGPRDDRGRHAT